MKIRKHTRAGKRLFIVCRHIQTVADVRHVKLYASDPGLSKAQRYGEVTCARTQGPDLIEESSLIAESVLRENLPGLLPS